MAWEGLPQPVQVVWRQALVPVEQIALEGSVEAAEDLHSRFDPRTYRLNISQAPLLQAKLAYDQTQERWLLLMLHHHMVLDHLTLEILIGEVQAHLTDQIETLPAPVPFRNFVSQARLGVSNDEHEAFFRDMLSDVDEPTAPFDVLDVRGDGSGIEEISLPLEADLAVRLRFQARRLQVSPASLFHLAWARVLACLTGQDDVVFGTVLLGRMQGGKASERTLGMFINTLPVRVAVGSDEVALKV